MCHKCSQIMGTPTNPIVVSRLSGSFSGDTTLDSSCLFLGTLLFLIPNCTINGSNKNQPSRKNSLSYLWAGVLYNYIPSRELAYPTLGKGIIIFKHTLGGKNKICILVPRRVFNFDQSPQTWAIYLLRLLFRFIPTPRPGPVLCRHLHRCCAWDKTLEFFHWQAVPYRCT